MASDSPLPDQPTQDAQQRRSTMSSDEISVLELVRTVWRRRRLVLALPVASLLLIVAVTLLRHPRYTVATSFLLQGGPSPSSASGLAARFGVVLPQSDPGQSPQFYGELVMSNELLRQLVLATYSLDSISAPRDLVDFFSASGDSQQQRVEDAIRQLRKSIRVTPSDETGLVRIEVTTKCAEISLQVASRMLEALNQFNIRRRQQTAAAERQFTQERTQEAALALRASEDSLQMFLQRNRQFQSSPELLFEHDRLSRRVAMRQALYTTMIQSLDNARLEEVRNTPLIAVVEPPRRPSRPDRRFLLVKGVLALILGSVAGVAGAFGIDAIERYTTPSRRV